MGRYGNSIHMLAKTPLLLSLAFVVTSCDSNSKTVTAPTPTTLPSVIEKEKPTPKNDIQFKSLTRFFCEPSSVESVSELFTFRPNSSGKLNTQKISFIDDAGNTLNDIDSFKLLQSDGDLVFGIIGEKSDAGRGLKIYSAEVNLKTNLGIIIPISDAVRMPVKLESSLEDLGHFTSYVGISYEFSYVLIPDKKSYTLRDMRTFNILNRIHLDPAQYFNPELSENGQWAMFTTRENDMIQQVQVSLITGKVTLLPTKAKTEAQLLTRWLNDEGSLAWLEQQGQNKMAYFATQKQLNEGKSALLFSFASPAKNAVTTFVKNGAFMTAWIENSQLKIASFPGNDSPQDAVLIKSFPYSDELMALEDVKNTMLSTLSYSPWTNELFASVKGLKGLVSFDINNEKWLIHSSADDAFSCTKPILGPELILETTR